MLTGKRLEAYLAYIVFGCNLAQPERSSQRFGPTTRRGPVREPCCACGVEDCSEAAHTGTDGGMSMKASDYSCVPLCSDCHTRAPGSYHRIGKRAFGRKHQLCFADLTARLEQEWIGKLTPGDTAFLLEPK
jgi:hypothetical protein